MPRNVTRVDEVPEAVAPIHEGRSTVIVAGPNWDLTSVQYTALLHAEQQAKR